MNLHITPSQRQFNEAHKLRFQKFWPKPSNEFVFPPISDSQFDLAWKCLCPPPICELPGFMAIDTIQRVVSEHFCIGQRELLAKRRTMRVVRPRQIAMYLAKECTTRSLPEIGRRFGDMDHTTVMHAIRRVEELIASDIDVERDVSKIKEKLGV